MFFYVKQIQLQQVLMLYNIVVQNYRWKYERIENGYIIILLKYNNNWHITHYYLHS